MTTQPQQGSATIHQFPARGRFAKSLRDEHEQSVAWNAKTATARTPTIAVGSGWYHDAAIEADRAGKQ